MSKLLLVAGLLMYTGPFITSMAATYYSRTDGTWSNTGPSGPDCSCVPSSNDDIVVGHTISLPGSYSTSSGGSITINSGGVLTITGGSPDGDLEIGANTSLTVQDGGVLTVSDDLSFRKNSVVFIAEGATIIVGNDFTNFNNSNNVTINGSLEINGNFTNGNNGEIEFGSNSSVTIIGTCTNDGTVTDPSGTYGGCGQGLLPIELLYFKAEQKSYEVALKWATSTEENFDFFTVERTNSEGDFEAIGRVNGSGNSNEILTYSYVDESPRNGSSYYRLKATDLDGTVEYHDVITVDFKRPPDKVDLYPSLVLNDMVNVLIYARQLAPYGMNVKDLSPATVYSTNLEAGANQVRFNRILKPGIHVTTIQNVYPPRRFKLIVKY